MSPAEFIPLAEQSGLVVQLGEWVLAQACRQALQWRERSSAPLVVAVNVSPRQCAQPGLAGMVRRTLRATNVAPAAIELEITEGVMVEGGQASGQTDLLRAWGCVEIQGYHYGRPLDAAAATSFIDTAQQRQRESIPAHTQV